MIPVVTLLLSRWILFAEAISTAVELGHAGSGSSVFSSMVNACANINLTIHLSYLYVLLVTDSMQLF